MRQESEGAVRISNLEGSTRAQEKHRAVSVRTWMVSKGAVHRDLEPGTQRKSFPNKRDFHRCRRSHQALKGTDERGPHTIYRVNGRTGEHSQASAPHAMPAHISISRPPRSCRWEVSRGTHKCEHTQRNGQVFKAAERGTRVQRRLGLKIRVEFRWGRSRHRERPESGWVRRSRRQSGNAAQVVSEQAGFPPVSYRAVVGDGR